MPYEPVDHLLFLAPSTLYGAARIPGRGDGDALPLLCVRTNSDRLWGVIRGDATGDNCVDDINEFRFDGGGYSEVNEGASERAAEKSSYEGMSERPPDVETVKDEPDILRGFSPPSKFIESPSIGGPEYLRSRIGIASSVVYACPIVMSPSSPGISRLSSQGFCAHVLLSIVVAG